MFYHTNSWLNGWNVCSFPYSSFQGKTRTNMYKNKPMILRCWKYEMMSRREDQHWKIGEWNWKMWKGGRDSKVHKIERSSPFVGSIRSCKFTLWFFFHFITFTYASTLVANLMPVPNVRWGVLAILLPVQPMLTSYIKVTWTSRSCEQQGHAGKKWPLERK